tara:strand:+ start:2050 stop:3492 length:1443 start_codon:yes stop_codon:yes gene_type:complete
MTKSKINLLFFFSVFPIWIFKLDFSNNDLILIISFFLVIFLANYFFLNFLKRDIDNNYFQLYLALLFVFGLDVNLGLLHGFIFAIRDFFSFERFLNIYFFSFISLVIILLISFFLIKKLKINGVKILFSFILVIFIFNIFDNTKNTQNIINFKKTEIINKNFKKTKLIIITDEMSGINSKESQTEEGVEFDKLAKEFSKKFNFSLYTNLYAVHHSSISSISSIFNRNYKKTASDKFHIKSKNYFNEFDFIKNETFDQFESISVFQSIHINFCENQKVLKCDQYNQFENNDFIEGFRDTFLGRFISAFKLYGSISAFFIARTLQEFDLIDLSISPVGDKAAFKNLLNKTMKDITSQKFDLIFLHAMTPHRPYGFDEDCKYSGKRSVGNYNLINQSESTYMHNIDRICTVKLLENFIKELKKQNQLERLEIIIFSDHGARIEMNNPESGLKSILMHRKMGANYNEIDDKGTVPEVFKSLMFD